MPAVPLSPNTCPADIEETAEAYVMNRLLPADALHFETHSIGCRQCATAATEAKCFARAVKQAAQMLWAEPSAQSRKPGCHWHLDSITPRPMGSFRAQMRFHLVV